MSPQRMVFTVLLIVATLVPGTGWAQPAAPQAQPVSREAGSLLFIENAGQWTPSTSSGQAPRYQVWGSPLGVGTMWLSEDAIWISIMERGEVETLERWNVGTLKRSNVQRAGEQVLPLPARAGMNPSPGAGHALPQTAVARLGERAFDANYNGFGDAFVSKLSVATTGPSAAALWTDQLPAIDGDFTDWGHWSPLVLSHDTASYINTLPAGSPSPTPADNSAELRALWTGTDLYFAVFVRDDAIVNDSPDVWRDDEIELAFVGAWDGDPAGADTHQYTVNADGRITDHGVPNPPIQAGGLLRLEDVVAPLPVESPWQASEAVYAYGPDCTRQSEPALAVNELGTAYAVWTDLRNGSSDLYFSYRPAAGEWQPNEPIPWALGMAAEVQPLSIAADSQGAVYMVWADDRNGDADIYFAYRAANGVWSDVVRINDDPGQATQADPVIAADPAGNVTVVWTDDRNGDADIYSSFRPAGGSWGANMRVNDDSGGEPQGSPDLAVDGSGNAYAVWLDWRAVEYNGVYAAYRPVQGSWAANDKIFDQPMLDPGRPGYQHQPALAVTPSGHATVVWETSTNNPNFSAIASADRPIGGTWSMTGGVDSGYVGGPDIALDGTGRAYVRFYAYDPQTDRSHIRFVERPPGGYWGYSETVQWIDVMAADPAGNVHILADVEEDIWAAVRSADGTWSGYVVVNDDYCSIPSGTPLAVDTAGHAYAAVGDTRSGKANIYLLQRPEGGPWGAPAEINDVPDTAMAPQIAFDPADNAAAIWLDTHNSLDPLDPDVYASRMSAGGSWEPSTQVSQLSVVTQPDIALDAAGNAYAVWMRYHKDHDFSGEVHFAFQPAGGDWSNAIEIFGGGAGEPTIAVDPAGNAHAIWNTFFWTCCPSVQAKIYAAYRPADGNWTYVRVDDGPEDTWRGSPDIAVDDSGNAYAIWEDARDGEMDIYFTYRPAGGVWSANLKVNDTAGVASDPALAVDAQGNAYGVWVDGRNGNSDIYFAYRPAGGSWQISARVDDDLGSAVQYGPDIAVDAGGNATALWMDSRNPTWHVYAAYADHDDIVRSTYPLDVQHAEAESLPRTGSMGLGSDDGASACQYVFDAVPWSGSAITFDVTVPNDDEYYLWARAMGLDWSQNSFWVSVDGSSSFHYEIGQFDNQWAWGWEPVHAEGQPVVPFSLGAGAHTVVFNSREPLSRLDAVLLVNRSGYVPTQFTPCGITPTPTATSTPTPTNTPTMTPSPTAVATPAEFGSYLPLIIRQ